jgi:hypothetical protein
MRICEYVLQFRVQFDTMSRMGSAGRVPFFERLLYCTVRLYSTSKYPQYPAQTLLGTVGALFAVVHPTDLILWSGTRREILFYGSKKITAGN